MTRVAARLGCGLAALTASAVALASPAVPSAYVRAASAHDVPPRILYALALTESGATLSSGRRPWPWTLNIGGRGVRYTSRAAACSALQSALEQTDLVDVGLGQLNIHWQQRLFGKGRRFANPCRALSPYANLDAAAGILARCHGEHPDSWVDAAGCYHRPAGGKPARDYERAVSARLARLQSVRTAEHNSAAKQASRPEREGTVQPTRLTWIDPERRIGARHGLD